MNATEDGDEPVGEAPELPPMPFGHHPECPRDNCRCGWTRSVDDLMSVWLDRMYNQPDIPIAYTIAEPGHIESIPVLGENERQAIAEIRALHQRVPLYLDCDYSGSTDRDVCDGGFESADGEWCCPTCTEADGGQLWVCASCRECDGGYIDWPCATAQILDKRGL